MQDNAFVKNEVAVNKEFKRDQTTSNAKITACPSTNNEAAERSVII